MAKLYINMMYSSPAPSSIADQSSDVDIESTGCLADSTSQMNDLDRLKLELEDLDTGLPCTNHANAPTADQGIWAPNKTAGGRPPHGDDGDSDIEIVAPVNTNSYGKVSRLG